MIYALGWLTITSLLVLWSLCAWALHAVVIWAVSHAGTLSGAVAGAAGITVPDWLAPWLPTGLVQAMNLLAGDLRPFVDSVLQTMPSLTAGLTVAAWAIWGVGCALLLLLGAGCHLLLAAWRRRGGEGAATPAVRGV